MQRVIAGPAGATLEEVDAPPVQACQVRIRSACSLVSAGTELHYVELARREGATLPLGYCGSGFVEALGEGVSGFTCGTPVIAMGWGHALHAPIISVPQRLCFPLPAGIPFSSAVFANLAATALHAVHRARLAADATVLVVGAGLVGQLVAQCAGLIARTVIITDRVAARTDIARACGVAHAFAGADWVERVGCASAGRGVDVIFVCTQGDATTLLAACVGLLANYADEQRRGVIVVVGRLSAFLELNVEMGNVDIRYAARCGAGYRNDDYVHGRMDVHPPQGEQTVADNLRDCVRLVAEGRLKVAPLVSRRFPMSSAAEAYRLLATDPSVLGVLFDYRDPPCEGSSA